MRTFSVCNDYFRSESGSLEFFKNLRNVGRLKPTAKWTVSSKGFVQLEVKVFYFDYLLKCDYIVKNALPLMKTQPLYQDICIFVSLEYMWHSFMRRIVVELATIANINVCGHPILV